MNREEELRFLRNLLDPEKVYRSCFVRLQLIGSLGVIMAHSGSLWLARGNSIWNSITEMEGIKLINMFYLD